MTDWMKRRLTNNTPPENKRTPRTRKTSIISSRIAIQSNAMIKEHNGKVFWDKKIVLFVNFLGCVATVNF